MNNNLVLFYDGCHKIYYAERTDRPTIDMMTGYGYEVIDGDFNKNLTELWEQSCGLRFVEPADLDFSKPHISQTDPARAMQGFKTKLSRYYGKEATCSTK